MITHFAIEPHAFAAAPDDDGIAIWSTIQHPYLLQRLMAKLLGMPLSKVRVYAPDPGGGFGGKQNIKYEPLVALMALQAGRPVRLVLTLDESFQASRRVSAEISVRSGFDRQGHVLFQDIHSDYMLGAYADIAERVVAKSQYTAAGPYKVPNVRIVARSILSNTTPACAFRGFGTPQINWAVEGNMDAGARALGIDRAEIRLRNLATRGEEVVPGDTPADGLWPQTVRAAMDAIGWDTPVPEGRGRGIAVGIKSSATTGLSYATVRLLVDGSVLVLAGTSDMGQGARTIFAQIAATEMGHAGGTGQRDHGRYRRRALRPADLCQPLDRLHGQRHHACLPRHPGAGASHGGSPRKRSREPGRGRPRQREPARPRRAPSSTSSLPGWASSAESSSATASTARRWSRTIRLAAARPSTSSTAPPWSCRSTRRPATSPSTAT